MTRLRRMNVLGTHSMLHVMSLVYTVYLNPTVARTLPHPSPISRYTRPGPHGP